MAGFHHCPQCVVWGIAIDIELNRHDIQGRIVTDENEE
jgi:hypothetical protein